MHCGFRTFACIILAIVLCFAVVYIAAHLSQSGDHRYTPNLTVRDPIQPVWRSDADFHAAHGRARAGLTALFKLQNKSPCAVIMVADHRCYPYYAQSIRINYAYARKHGYDFFAHVGRLLPESTHAPHYDRYKALQDHCSAYEYLLYIDADAYVHDATITMEHLGRVLSSQSILASDDLGPGSGRKLKFNSGVLFVRSGESAQTFCRLAMEGEPDCLLKRCRCAGWRSPPHFFDQCAIDRQQELHKLVRVLPYGQLQCFPIHKTCSSVSFVEHFPGMDRATRERQIRRAKHRGQTHTCVLVLQNQKYARQQLSRLHDWSQIHRCEGYVDKKFPKATTETKHLPELRLTGGTLPTKDLLVRMLCRVHRHPKVPVTSQSPDIILAWPGVTGKPKVKNGRFATLPR
jgi:hypothetical protein